ncbi:amidohydrolase [Aureimonas fodinaquatilis]|uniref:Amidohydrolase n=1 Tax=Aureimonas fodinaquatilis TaxID=2565783 RepID=A0A5B0DRZ3_9HYPH|nr:amidohydrolase family protein [Aureimonas fodinaquatilis]KAA0969574.1 amidohydrolase [Aureimonas fodinaquatilis]
MKHSVIDTSELGSDLNRYGPTAGRKPGPGTNRPDTITIDIHAHISVPEAAAYAAPHLNIADIAMVKFSNDETRSINHKQDQDRGNSMVDLEDRLAVLDKMRIDFQVVAPPPFQCYYTLPVEHAIKASQLVNDGVAAFVARRPDRFAGIGTVALQDPAEAAKELERCVKELGLKGVQVLTNVQGEEIGDARFEAFWKKAEELGCLVIIHPNGFSHGERFRNYYFSNVIGNPLETTIALHHIIFNGVLERYPNLRILAVHGGGFLPAYSGRIDHAWGARQDSHAKLPKPPSEYLRKVYFDSVVFTPHQLEYLVKLYGADKIVMGTDYPYDMADYDPVGHILSSENLTSEEMSKVAGLTTAKLLGISK